MRRALTGRVGGSHAAGESNDIVASDSRVDAEEGEPATADFRQHREKHAEKLAWRFGALGQVAELCSRQAGGSSAASIARRRRDG